MHFGINDNLGFPVMVAQVDEDNAAMVADTVNPSGKPDFFADVFFSKSIARVCSVRMHETTHS